jgi:hypothetical protein
VHCDEPCLSQAGGCGSLSARVFVPLVEKVGLLQPWMIVLVAVGTVFPGIRCSCANPASTRLIGSAEYPSWSTCCWPSHRRYWPNAPSVLPLALLNPKLESVGKIMYEYDDSS